MKWRRRDKRRSFFVSYAYRNESGTGFAMMDVSFIGPLKASTITEIQQVIGKARELDPSNIVLLNIQAFEA